MVRFVCAQLACLSLLLLSGSQVDGQDNQSDVVKVDAARLLKEFKEAGRDALTKKYKGKSLEVTGWVRASLSAGGGRWDVSLEDTPGSSAPNPVSCYFNKDQVAAAKKITARSKVVIKGTWDEKGRAIRLRDCRVIDAGAPKK